MSNFIEEFKKGQQGTNKGLPMGAGLTNISKAINGVQRGRVYGVAAAPKVGKTTIVDYAFILNPFLYYLANPTVVIEWIYFSYEIDRVSKEFDFAAFFLNYDYGISTIILPDGIKKDGKNTILLSPDYLRGRLQDDEEQIIKVSDDIFDKLKLVYANRILPLFGEFNAFGQQLSKGLMTFIEQKDNPTGVYKYLLKHGEKNGTYLKEKHGKSYRNVSFTPNNPQKYTIVVIDHVRKVLPERGFSKKETVDKLLEYVIDLKKLLQYTFVPIIHLNRSMADQRRLMDSGDMLFPNSDDIKDTGNLSEDADYIFTMFNPNDDRYRLDKHFNLKIKDSKGNEFFPNMRTIHLVESRHCFYPQHFRTNMHGHIKSFSLFQKTS